MTTTQNIITPSGVDKSNQLHGGLAGSLYAMMFLINSTLGKIANNYTSILESQATLQLNETTAAAQSTIDAAQYNADTMFAKAGTSIGSAITSGAFKSTSWVKTKGLASESADIGRQIKNMGPAPTQTAGQVIVSHQAGVPAQIRPEVEAEITSAATQGGIRSQSQPTRESADEAANEEQHKKAVEAHNEKLKTLHTQQNTKTTQIQSTQQSWQTWEQLFSPIVQAAGSGTEGAYTTYAGKADADSKLATTNAQLQGGNADNARQAFNQIFSKMSEIIQTIARAAQAAPQG